MYIEKQKPKVYQRSKIEIMLSENFKQLYFFFLCYAGCFHAPSKNKTCNKRTPCGSPKQKEYALSNYVIIIVINVIYQLMVGSFHGEKERPYDQPNNDFLP